MQRARALAPRSCNAARKNGSPRAQAAANHCSRGLHSTSRAASDSPHRTAAPEVRTSAGKHPPVPPRAARKSAAAPRRPHRTPSTQVRKHGRARLLRAPRRAPQRHDRGSAQGLPRQGVGTAPRPRRRRGKFSFVVQGLRRPQRCRTAQVLRPHGPPGTHGGGRLPRRLRQEDRGRAQARRERRARAAPRRVARRVARQVLRGLDAEPSVAASSLLASS